MSHNSGKLGLSITNATMIEFLAGNESELELKWERDGDALIAVVSGRIDSTNVYGLEQSINEGLTGAHQVLVLDLAAVHYVSSAALALMLRLAKRYLKESRDFGMCTETRDIRDVISISGFDRIIRIFDTRADTLSELRAA